MKRGRFLHQRLEEVAEGRTGKAGFGRVGSAKGVGRLVGWYFFGIVLVLSGLVLSEAFGGTFLSVFHDPLDFVWSNTSFYYYYYLFFTLHTHFGGVLYPRENSSTTTCYGCHVMVGNSDRYWFFVNCPKENRVICNSLLLNLLFCLLSLLVTWLIASVSHVSNHA